MYGLKRDFSLLMKRKYGKKTTAKIKGKEMIPIAKFDPIAAQTARQKVKLATVMQGRPYRKNLTMPLELLKKAFEKEQVLKRSWQQQEKKKVAASICSDSR